MKKYFFTFLVLVLGLVTFVPAQAQLVPGADRGFGKYLQQTFGETFDTGADLEKSLPSAIGNIISIFLSLIGVLLLVIMVYAGYLWLTAGGNEDQVDKAKTWIKNAVIGLIIALSAFIITSFVVSRVQQALSDSATSSGQSQGGGTGLSTQPASNR